LEKELKVCTLTGPEKLKAHTLLPSIHPSECGVDKIQHLWAELLLLNKDEFASQQVNWPLRP